MNWKAFTAVCTVISSALISVPQNLIGCGGEIDPYDYYLSFFNQYAASQIQYKPFFYTNALFLFDEYDAVNAEDLLVKEWGDFTGATVSEKDANDFVMQMPAKDVSTIYYHIEKNSPAVLPDSIARNGMSKYFLKSKNLEALGYILYAKKVQPLVTESNYWSPETKDSLAMDRLIKNGLQLYNASKTDLFKLKYAYQVTRLAHYNNRYTDAIKYYDEMIAGNPTKSVLQSMSLALKAGALYRLGKREEAAYLFSKAFTQNKSKKVTNYISFDWALGEEVDKKHYLSFCKNNEEKAGMLSMFLLGNPEPDLEGLKEIYQLHPSSEMLSTLVVREINKYEDDYLTPLTGRENNIDPGKFNYFYYQYFDNRATDSSLTTTKSSLKNFTAFLNVLASDKKVADPALMQLGAAYGAYMLRDFVMANEYLAKTKNMKMSPRVEEQWMLTNLLTNISAQEKLDAAFEEKILPSLQWLYKKAAIQKRIKNGSEEDVMAYYNEEENGQWQRFYRNLMVDILSQRYKAQGDVKKALLTLGSTETTGAPSFTTAIDYLHSEFNGQQAEDLYNYFEAKKFTPYEAFLVKCNKIKSADAADFAGTGYLRDNNYSKAIDWLQKVPGDTIEKDPFKELMFDREERLPGDIITTSKLAYAKEMKRLQELVVSDKANAAKYLYKMALGLYNTTHYGYAWELVEYYRSGVDGYYIPKGATAFQKEYYGAFTAEQIFKKAMEASNDKEFKSKCLFMMAKCSQKQIRKPQYGDFENYDVYEKNLTDYQNLFMANKYNRQLHTEFGNTNFYKDALTRCSYLSDFK